jgi:hypothetical protein
LRSLRVVVIALAAALAVLARQQDGNDPALAAALINDAIKARGGDAYLNVRTLVGEGEYTAFNKGLPGIPDHFVDYIVYPDRERTEFRKGSHKFIQVNVGESGWVYDAEQKQIREQTAEEIKRWLQGIRYDLDNLLRRGWKEPGAKLIYLGRREAWRNTFSEAVRIEFADGASVNLHFDPRTKLPMMSEYKMIGEEGTFDEQIRYFQWLDFNGIKFPNIQDTYRNGQQVARVNYTSVNFNVNLADKLFTKPASIKDVK